MKPLRYPYRFVGALAAFVLLSAIPANALGVLDYVYSVREGGTVVFSHDKHFKALFPNKTINGDDCITCHSTIYKSHGKRPVTMSEMYSGRSCGACHGKRAFSLSKCGRCHTVKDVSFRVQPTGDVIFPHAAHISKIQCDVCHPRLFKPSRNRSVGMAQMEKGKSCGACHKGKIAFALEDCSRCHLAGNVLMKARKPWEVNFRHAAHLPAYKCVDCHPRVFKLGYEKSRPRMTMQDMDKGKSCGACHDDQVAFSTRFNCQRCHDNM
ncbi:c(7)-type cytochrome triheme domain-containing protein [Geomonas agri]|uniref:c(7)-type cytochrome triheme domain-containing protein n=1 Tax=Geomonas agri TaxID=2873702 RepID=UPI001CD7E5BB|nr:c(7)-type cytochrome triheme domain-containing protein [Geomonas agri]